MSKWTFLLLASLSALTLHASPWSFESASSNVCEYVIDRLTNSIRCGCSVALLQERDDDSLRPEDWPPVLFEYGEELGLHPMRCVCLLKGEPQIASYSLCHFYYTPRMERKLSQIWIRSGGGFGCFTSDVPTGASFCPIEGKEKRRYFPPYNPFDYECDEYVKLMLITPVHAFKVDRIDFDALSGVTNGLISALGGSIANKTGSQIVEELGLASVFSNRVFELNEACAFQVDCPVPELEWKSKFYSQSEWQAHLATNRLEQTSLMRLSADEASEITYLSYLVSGDANGYEQAVSRCPSVLHSVTNIHTCIGLGVYRALQMGGALTNGCDGVAALPSVND